MPELVTRYPKLAIQELQDAKLTCGKGAIPKILTKCPSDRFCALPTGELCIYGLQEVPTMSQINAMDLFYFPSFVLIYVALLVLSLACGVLLGVQFKGRGLKTTSQQKK